MSLSEELDSTTRDTAGTVSRHDTTETFESTDPASGAVVGVFPVHDADAVRETVERARPAAAAWRALGVDGGPPRPRPAPSPGSPARRMHELADLMHRENGKPHADAILEITLAVDHLAWAAKNAKRVLGPRGVPSGLLAANQAATLEYQPFGVIGVIGPWNYPVFTPMGSLAYALAACNAVVFKPSEFTPAVGGWLVSSFAEVVPEKPVLQLITGAGTTGEALALSAVNKIAFTGSSPTARKVMAACAQNLTPMIAECGGKDAMLIGADADLDAAADAAA